MKSTILNLIAVAALFFNWTAQAAEEMERKAQPPAQPVATASAVPPATTPVSTPPAPAQKPQPSVKRSTPSKHAKAKMMRSKDLDLRHCLELESNVAIAKCAGE